MTAKGSLLKVVTPAKAGVQALIRNEVKCCSNHETVNKALPAREWTLGESANCRKL
jgi:hypothetical protein